MVLPDNLANEQAMLVASYLSDDTVSDQTDVWDYILKHGSKELIDFSLKAIKEKEQYSKEGKILN